MEISTRPRHHRSTERRSFFGIAPRTGAHSPALDDLPESEILLRQAQAIVNDLRRALTERSEKR